MHLLLEDEQGRDVEAVQLALRGLRERVHLVQLVHVRGGRQDLDHGPGRHADGEGRDGAAQGRPRGGELDGRAEDDAPLLHGRDRLLGPGVPVHDPQAVLLGHEVQVHAHAAELGEDRLRGLGRDDEEPGPAGLEALREEREGEEELLVPRGTLQHDGRALGQAAAQHGVKSRNARGQPHQGISSPRRGPGRSGPRGRGGCRWRRAGRTGRPSPRSRDPGSGSTPATGPGARRP